MKWSRACMLGLGFGLELVALYKLVALCFVLCTG